MMNDDDFKLPLAIVESLSRLKTIKDVRDNYLYDSVRTVVNI